MYKPNRHHLQPLLISNVQDLPEKHQHRLEQSWAGVFYRELFCRLNEAPFAVLYADLPSRPNIPVNVLVGLETLKAGFGWSDEELYDHFVFDLQVRYALGYRDLHEGDFDLRTLYNFRRRLSAYNLKQGVNLLDAAFAGITDQQITVLKLDPHQQRMDSTQIASNIRDMNRLQLLVEACQHLYRSLAEEDQARYGEAFAPYLQGPSGQYVYRIKGQDATRHQIQQVGEAMAHLLPHLADRYAKAPALGVFARLFGDNFHVVADQVQAKANEEIRADCLQSCDDREASFRRKAEREYKGYVTNVTETCTPGNPLQLITSIQTAPNTTEDTDLLIAALPGLKERTGVESLHTDGGYASPEADQVLQQQHVEQVPTAIKGRAPDPSHLSLGDYAFRFDGHGVPDQITCPGGQTAAVRWGVKQGALVADFGSPGCEACPFHLNHLCRAKAGKRDARFHLDFNLHEARVAHRRRLKKDQERSGHNLRAAVEATMRVIKHPFPAGKLPVRGLFRVSCMILGSALMANVRSITRYEYSQQKQERQHTKDQTQSQDAPETVLPSFLRRIWIDLTGFLRSWSLALSWFSC